MYASLGCRALSAKCTAGAMSLGFVFLGVTPDSAETPFAETPFYWFLNFYIFSFVFSGANAGVGDFVQCVR